MDSWLTNGSEKGPYRGVPGVKMVSWGLKEVNLGVRTRIGDIVNTESDMTLPLLQGLV